MKLATSILAKKFFLFLVILLPLTCVVLGEDMLDNDVLDYTENALTDSVAKRVSLIIPAVLLVVCIISFSIDFGTVGVTTAAMGSLVILYFLEIVFVNPVSLLSFVIMSGIIIFKLPR